MREAMNLQDAKAEVARLLKDEAVKRGDHADTEVSIELWWDGDLEIAPKCIGVRVAEVSFIKRFEGGMCGGSIMQCDPSCLDAIAAVERAIIERMVCTLNDESWAQEINDADWRMFETVFKPEKS